MLKRLCYQLFFYHHKIVDILDMGYDCWKLYYMLITNIPLKSFITALLSSMVTCSSLTDKSCFYCQAMTNHWSQKDMVFRWNVLSCRLKSEKLSSKLNESNNSTTALSSIIIMIRFYRSNWICWFNLYILWRILEWIPQKTNVSGYTCICQLSFILKWKRLIS